MLYTYSEYQSETIAYKQRMLLSSRLNHAMEFWGRDYEMCLWAGE